MNALNKLTSISRTTEVNSVVSRIIFEYEKTEWSSDTHLTGVFNLLKGKNEILTDSINRIKANSNLKEKDKIRDEKVRSVHYLILGFMHSPDLAIKSAAQEVYKMYEHFGLGIINQSYATASSLIHALLLEFSNASLQPSIVALPGLSQLIEELTTAQSEFDAASVIYDEEKAAEGTKENASKIKKEVLSLVNDKLVVYLRAMIQVDEAKYGELTRTIAQTIDDNNIAVNKRKKKAKPVVEQ
ncbi:MAG: hypothetical protein KKF62_15605 [Bacteroidetes bacterium]|nr:hypothetical protein [Bacteroidota bacterium]MBU1115996.1 hypothetical protein [Bacteroidota bacterium]MBU1799236.1 hypothetical protein [Bacteroidota bacterium]